MDILKTAYPDDFVHKGVTYAGRQKSNREISIGMSDNSIPFSTGDIISMVILDRSRDFEILDYKRANTSGFMPGLESIISLTVRPLDVKEKQQTGATHITFNGPVTSGGDIQAGSVNSITKHITLEQLHKAIEDSSDPEVKSLWEKLTNNASFVAITSAIGQSLLG
ncbi:hypothetical protein I5M99_18550 [Serratia marcescens]|uniref:hypothetical protein n=1 Tax=Serratia ureilytica TaxID=300181 RepID=UPI0018D3D908|nr:hypothetical protein [Serratia ureilytica]MBH1912029.1 hypothetical protein [Serratia ureilytica]MBH3138807.1 hypothetical protein [Serratia marcescens]